MVAQSLVNLTVALDSLRQSLVDGGSEPGQPDGGFGFFKTGIQPGIQPLESVRQEWLRAWSR